MGLIQHTQENEYHHFLLLVHTQHNTEEESPKTWSILWWEVEAS